MRRSESWAKSKIAQNSTMRVAHIGIVSKFGSGSRANRRKRKKIEDDVFGVGITEVGGEEVV